MRLCSNLIIGQHCHNKAANSLEILTVDKGASDYQHCQMMLKMLLMVVVVLVVVMMMMMMLRLLLVVVVVDVVDNDDNGGGGGGGGGGGDDDDDDSDNNSKMTARACMAGKLNWRPQVDTAVKLLVLFLPTDFYQELYPMAFCMS